MKTLDDVMNYITSHANMDIEQNRMMTGRDYTPAVGWLIERIVMKSCTPLHGDLPFPQNVMFTETPNLKEMIKRFGGGDRVEFFETTKCAVAVHEYLRSHPHEGVELRRKLGQYGEELQIIEGNRYNYLYPIEVGPAYPVDT